MVAALALVAPPAAAQEAEPTLEVRWAPGAPLEGSLVSIVLVPRAPGWVVAAAGSLSGEPLHFEPLRDGSFRALGPVPLGRADSLWVAIHVHDFRGVPDSLAAWISVAARRVRSERIRPGAQYTRPPDAALARRIARERELVRVLWERTHERPRLWCGPFVRPRNSRITSPFGTRRVIVGGTGGGSRHWGVDLDGVTGAPVRAANRGVVALTGDFFYSGNTIYVDHGAGIVTGYLHLSRILVAVGDTVDAGQLIGRVGATGRVTGPHLHWLAHYGGISIDPLGLTEVAPFEPPADTPDSPSRP
ncbi:MAG: M23 family metallopeptidase [Gemmatimonadales bacterium]